MKNQNEIEKAKIKEGIIRELKKKHPKGFCYICGKVKATNHHLKEQIINSSGKLETKKVNGIIPLCRDCHNYIEKLKVNVNAYKRGFTQGTQSNQKDVLRIIENIKNPYPEDIFPKLTQLQLDKVDALLEQVLKIPLDRLSADLMRRARDNLIEELKNELKQNEQTKIYYNL